MDPLALEQQGLAHKAAGRFDEAISSFIQLTRLQPLSHGAAYNLGNCYLAAARMNDAVEAYRHAARLAPDFVHAHNNLGVALLRQGRLEEAASSLVTAAGLAPANPAIRHLAGNALLRTGQAEAALPHLQAAHGLAPNNADIIIDLSGAYARLGAYHEAAPLARQAVLLQPGKVELWNNLAIAEKAIGRLEASEASCRRALALAPGNAQSKYILATTLLTAGRLEEAWPLWEHRWDALPAGKPRIAGPRWDGGALPGGILCLHAEEGLGDTIQFCRYAAMAAALAEVTLIVQPPLVRLMRTLAGPARVIADGDAPPPFAAQAPLLSLPGIFQTTAATLPASIPYLHAEPALAAQWASRLATLPGRRVGMVWEGNPDNPFDAVRSAPAHMLAGLQRVAGVSFVSLQLAPRDRPDMPMADWTGELADFADTAALVSGLDLVIGVDTSVVHLAGALGRPVWLLNRFDSDWRWGAAGDGCAWYSTLRQFRQAEPGGWTDVIARVCSALSLEAGR
jgi:Flp pilus assembly protein TadD